jgi:DNA-binding LacI/PurR family transcriptional regulator
VGALVQAGLLERRHGSGTFIRDPEAGKAIGVLIEQDISCPGTSFYWIRMTQQLRRRFEEAGFATRLYAGHTRVGEPEPERPTCAEFWKDLQDNRLRALAIVGTPIKEDWLRELRERGVPLVSGSTPGVLPDVTAQMIREGTRYLIEHGRRAIAVLTWGTAGHPYIEYESFRREMAVWQIPIHDEWVCQMGIPTHDSFAGLDGFKRIWQSGATKPDGLLICSDRLMHSALSAIRLLNVDVPRELMVVGHVHRGEANADPPVPVVRLEVDPDEHARRLCDALLQQVNGQPVSPDPNFVAYRLIEPGAAQAREGGS